MIDIIFQQSIKSDSIEKEFPFFDERFEVFLGNKTMRAKP